MPIIVTNNFPPSLGGIQTMMLELAIGLHERGLHVAVVAPDAPQAHDVDQELPYQVVRYRGLRRPFELLAILSAVMTVRKRSPKTPYLASAWWPVGLALAVLPLRMRGPLVIFAHGTEIAPRRKGIRMLLMRVAFARASLVIANSNYTAQLLADCGVRKHTFVIPLGVAANRIQPRRATNPTILSVGRLVPRKGFDRVLQSMPSLISTFPTLQYEIIGDGPQRDELVALTRELKLEAHVCFLGRASEPDLEKAYARAWCFALPVRNVDDDVEGFGLVYLEAAMAELPTLGGRDSGASDAIENNITGMLVDGDDVTAVSEALFQLLQDRERATKMGRHGRERAETQFLWTRTVDRLLDLLKKTGYTESS